MLKKLWYMLKFSKLIVLIFVLTNFMYSCKTKVSEIDPDNLNLLLADPNFPIINPINHIALNKFIGYSCDSCFSSYDSSKLFLYKLQPDSDRNSLTIDYLDMNPTTTYTYDSSGLIVGKYIRSCFDWDVSYIYYLIDHLYIKEGKVVNANKKIKGKMKIDIDEIGRIKKLEGNVFGDLKLNSQSKKVFYTALNIYPDSALTTYDNDSLYLTKTLKQYFYVNNNNFDSIISYTHEQTNNYNVKDTLTHVYNTNGILTTIKSKRLRTVYLEYLVK